MNKKPKTNKQLPHHIDPKQTQNKLKKQKNNNGNSNPRKPKSVGRQRPQQNRRIFAQVGTQNPEKTALIPCSLKRTRNDPPHDPSKGCARSQLLNIFTFSLLPTTSFLSFIDLSRSCLFSPCGMSTFTVLYPNLSFPLLPRTVPPP